MTSFTIKEIFPIPAIELYEAWLDSDIHSAMTGGTAITSDGLYDKHTAWDNYISGKNMKLEKPSRIIQTWRTTEFDEEDEDSIITLSLKDTNEGVELMLEHRNIPDNQPDYEQGWKDHYFAPMKEYFNNNNNS